MWEWSKNDQKKIGHDERTARNGNGNGTGTKELLYFISIQQKLKYGCNDVILRHILHFFCILIKYKLKHSLVYNGKYLSKILNENEDLILLIYQSGTL